MRRKHHPGQKICDFQHHAGSPIFSRSSLERMTLTLIGVICPQTRETTHDNRSSDCSTSRCTRQIQHSTAIGFGMRSNGRLHAWSFATHRVSHAPARRITSPHRGELKHCSMETFGYSRASEITENSKPSSSVTRPTHSRRQGRTRSGSLSQGGTSMIPISP